MSEREAIVAWLRQEARRHQANAAEYRKDGCGDGSIDNCLSMSLTCLDNAVGIERGDHLKDRP